MIYNYKTQGTCCKKIEIELEGNIIKKVNFVNGCDGNEKGIAMLVEGRSVDEVKGKLSGIICNGRTTSCPDQLAKALEEAVNQYKDL